MDKRLEIIFKRRSIRKYKEKSIDQDDITSLLQAGMAAPSARNDKPWHFIVINEKDILSELASAHPYGKMLKHAALAIVVCGEVAISDWWVQDCAAATENILVAASALGLGAVWLGCYGRMQREKAVAEVLNIPDNITVFSCLSIGYPDEKKDPRTQFDKKRVHFNRW